MHKFCKYNVCLEYTMCVHRISFMLMYVEVKHGYLRKRNIWPDESQVYSRMIFVQTSF